MNTKWLKFYALILILFPLMLYASLKSINVDKSDTFIPEVTRSVSPTKVLLPSPTLAPQKFLESNYHTFQTFNNCGPASLSMALSYYGVNLSQKVIGDELRPYQVPEGDNDDKSVTQRELRNKSEALGFTAYHRPGGNIEVIKKLISLGYPVITRTWTYPNEDIGHYRVIKGYDDTAKTLLQDDSLQGKNLSYKYDYFNSMWDKFGYEFLVFAPPENKEELEKALGELTDERTAWIKAKDIYEKELMANPTDANTRLNLSVALYYLKDFKASVEEFEKAENSLPKRALWYQIEPLYSYYELGRYDKVFEITDKIIKGDNRAYSEVYILRGNIYKKENELEKARTEYEKAVRYNVNLLEAREALNSVN